MEEKIKEFIKDLKNIKVEKITVKDFSKIPEDRYSC